MRRRRSILVFAALDGLLLVSALLIVTGTRTPDDDLLIPAGLRPQRIELSGARGERVIEVGSEAPVLLRGDSEFPARADRLALVVSALEAARIMRTVTTDRSDWDSFGVATDRRRIDVYGETDASVIIGEQAESETYVRLAGESSVYAIDSNIGFYADQPDEFWMPLRVVPQQVRPTDVTAASLVLSWDGIAVEVNLVRTSTGWFVDDPARSVPSEVATQAVSSLVDQIADTLVEPSAAVGSVPLGTIAVRTVTGAAWEIAVRGMGDMVFLEGPGSDPPRTASVLQVMSTERFAAVVDPFLRL